MPSRKLHVRKRRPEEAWIPGLEGLHISRNIRQVQFATQIIGDIFERLSKEVMGPQWDRIYPMSDSEIRPDLGSRDNLNFIESKASQHRFKCDVQQIHVYQDFMIDMMERDLSVNLCYHLWTYGDRTIRLVEDGKTVEGVIALALGNVVQLDILHWTIIAAMLKRLPKNVSYKEYTSWKRSGNCEGGVYKLMQFGEPVLKRLRMNPDEFLYYELGLPPSRYACQTNYRKEMRRKVVVDGIEFQTNRFKVHRYVLAPEALSPVITAAPKRKVKETIPF